MLSSFHHPQKDSKTHSPSQLIIVRKLRRFLVAILIFIAGRSLTQYCKLCWFPNLWSPNLPATRKSLTVVVPEFGDMGRMPVLKQSLESIRASLQAKHYGFNCQVYVLSNWEAFVNETKSNLPFCKIRYKQRRYWTYHMKAVPSLSSDYVAVLKDDIDVFTHKLDTAYMLNRMEFKGYNMVSSSFQRESGLREGLHERPECYSHETGYVDILYTIFDHRTWKCWQDQIDLRKNFLGWGYSTLVGDVCKAKIGVIDKHGLAVRVMHPCDEEGLCGQSLHEDKMNFYEARNQMERLISDMLAQQTTKNITLLGYPPGEVPVYPFDISDESEDGDANTGGSRSISQSEAVFEYRSKVLERWRNHPHCD